MLNLNLICAIFFLSGKACKFFVFLNAETFDLQFIFASLEARFGIVLKAQKLTVLPDVSRRSGLLIF